MRIDLTKYVPPGQDIKEEKGLFILGMCGAVIFSMGYLSRYAQAWRNLYEWEDGRRIELKGIMMKGFLPLLENALVGFLILAIAMLGFIAYHYMYYYKDSKSIYLMKRLPDKFEMHRRCISIPLMAVFASILAAVVILFIYLGVYVLFTPKECMTSGWWL